MMESGVILRLAIRENMIWQGGGHKIYTPTDTPVCRESFPFGLGEKYSPDIKP